MKANSIILSLFAGFSFLTFQPVAAQLPDYHIQIIKGSNILNTNQVEQIMKDSKGFLWLLSPSRVQRFDGKNFKTFSFDDRCGSIVQDEDGNIWVMARNHLYRYHNDHSGFIDITPQADPEVRYRRMHAGPGSKLYLLTNTGIKWWNREKKEFESSAIPAFKSTENFPILKSYGSYLFYAFGNKLFRFDVATGKQDSVACMGANYLFAMNEDSVWVRQELVKRPWFHLSTKLYRLFLLTNSMKNLPTIIFL